MHELKNGGMDISLRHKIHTIMFQVCHKTRNEQLHPFIKAADDVRQ